MNIEIPVIKNMTPQEREEASRRVAMASAEKLAAWAEASGRGWIVFNTKELIEALPWPDGHQFLQQIIACLRDYRATKQSGRFETVNGSEIPIMKSEELEVEELDRAIRFLVGKITEKNPQWTLDGQPL